MLAHIFGSRDVEKERRLNRKARRFDPHHQVQALHPFLPSPGQICQDPRHATPRQLQAAGVRFPVRTLRRGRGGRWEWVTIDRPDGQRLNLPQPCQHGPGFFCRNCYHGSPWAVGPGDDDWETVLGHDGPYHQRETHGRRPSPHRHRPGGTLHLNHDDCLSDDHHHHHHHQPRHHKRYRNHHDYPRLVPHGRHHLDLESVYDEAEFSDLLAGRAVPYPRHHDANHVFFRPRRARRQELLSTSSTIEDDDDLFYVCDTDEEEATEVDEDVYSDLETSASTY